jgi:hypothetical protein
LKSEALEVAAQFAEARTDHARAVAALREQLAEQSQQHQAAIAQLQVQAVEDEKVARRVHEIEEIAKLRESLEGSQQRETAAMDKVKKVVAKFKAQQTELQVCSASARGASLSLSYGRHRIEQAERVRRAHGIRARTSGDHL